jgi:hypothetical protein
MMVLLQHQRMSLVFLAMVSLSASAQTTSSVTIVAPAAATALQPIAPGQSGSLSFTLRNDGGTPESADVVGALESADAVLQQYQITSSVPDRCGAPIHDVSGVLSRLSFTVGPLAANETLTCNYQVTRSAGSRDDLGFSLCGPKLPGVFLAPFCGRLVRFGTLPDTALSFTREGIAEDESQTIRVRVANAGAEAIAPRRVATECVLPASDPLFPPITFSLEGGFPGACPVASEPCTAFGGDPSIVYTFDLPAVAAASESSCLVRLRPRPVGSQPATETVRLAFREQHVRLPDGAVVFDANPANDTVTLKLFPDGPEVPCQRCEDTVIATTPASGIWRNPEASGTGLMLQSQNGLMMGAYFGFRADGTSAWYTFNGRIEVVAGAPPTLRVFAPLERLEDGTCVGCEYRVPRVIRDSGYITLEFTQRNHGTYSIAGRLPANIVPLVAGVDSRREFDDVQYAFPNLTGQWVIAFHDEDAGTAWRRAVVAVDILEKSVFQASSGRYLRYDIKLHPSAPGTEPAGQLQCGPLVTTTPPPGEPPICALSLRAALPGIDVAPVLRFFPLPYGNIGDNRIVSFDRFTSMRVEAFRVGYD